MNIFKWLPHHDIDEALAAAKAVAEADAVFDVVLKKGRFYGSIEYEAETNTLYVVIKNIKGLVLHEAETVGIDSAIAAMTAACADIAELDKEAPAQAQIRPGKYHPTVQVLDIDQALQSTLGSVQTRLTEFCTRTYRENYLPYLQLKTLRSQIIVVEALVVVAAAAITAAVVAALL